MGWNSGFTLSEIVAISLTLALILAQPAAAETYQDSDLSVDCEPVEISLRPGQSRVISFTVENTSNRTLGVFIGYMMVDCPMYVRANDTWAFSMVNPGEFWNASFTLTAADCPFGCEDGASFQVAYGTNLTVDQWGYYEHGTDDGVLPVILTVERNLWLFYMVRIGAVVTIISIIVLSVLHFRKRRKGSGQTKV